MKLFSIETKLQQIESLTLTSCRIRKAGGYDSKQRRVREVASIRLEHITHCQITSTDQPALVVIGVLLIIGGLIGSFGVNSPIFFVMGLVLGAIPIIAYYQERHCEIEIASPTLALRQRVQKKGLEDAMDFVHEVELAATERSDARRGHARAVERVEAAQMRGRAEGDYWGG